MSAIVTLTALDAPLPVGPFVFAAAATVAVGRGEDCPVRILDVRPTSQVSRHHCELALDPPAASVRDTNSKAGTFVNDLRIDATPRPLHDGDVLRLADFSFRVAVSPLECFTCKRPLTSGYQLTPAGRPLCPVGVDCAPLTCPPGPHSDAARQLLAHVPSLPGYVNEGRIGGGGMGEVYRLFDAAAGRRAALKVVLPAYADDSDLLARFQDEIANTRALAGPDVVEVLDSGRHGDTYYYLMEYCDGGNLGDLVALHGPRAAPDAVALIRPVLDVLERAERLGILHRDLKPKNLLLTGSPKAVKVADFGLTRGLDDQKTKSQTGFGTPPFCHRSQMIDAKRVGREVDVWAAAACLFFLLTGHPPRHTMPGATVVTGVPSVRRIGTLRPNLSPALAAVIDDALREDAFTYPTAAAFRAGLDAAGV